jgi:hypothetical protein
MKEITKNNTSTIRLINIMIIILLILISSNLSFSQDYIRELPRGKNQLFALLKVKIETIHQELLRGNDSNVISKNINKNYYDTRGYLIKKEIFDSSFTTPNFVREYRYDENGLYTEFFLNGSLRERREYNDSGKLTYRYFFDNEIQRKTEVIRYDSLGSEIEILINYSSGKIDTFLLTRYNYDFSINPPKIISDTSFYNEYNYRKLIISELDSIGRCTRLIILHPENIRNDTTLFFYNDKNLFDSTISYSNKGTRKYIREYDNYYRLTKTIKYSNTDSSPNIWNYIYDDNIFMTIDSLFQKNELDLTEISVFEMTGVVLETLLKGENEIRIKIMTQYNSNGLIKNTFRYDYHLDKIEQKFYDYEYF